MPAAEAEGYRNELAEFFRKRGTSMHPLQTDLSSAPPPEVIDKVQGSSKGDPTTFFGSGHRDALRIFASLRQ